MSFVLPVSWSRQGTVSRRLRESLAGGTLSIHRRGRQVRARQAGSLAALAALLYEATDDLRRPVTLAIAAPLVPQREFYMALSSELHYLTSVEICLQFPCLHHWLWRKPLCRSRELRRCLQSFVTLVSPHAPYTPGAMWVKVLDGAAANQRGLEIDVAMGCGAPTTWPISFPSTTRLVQFSPLPLVE